MWILGISKSHNGSVALINNGKVVCAIQAERISRIKRQAINLTNDKSLVSKCVKYCFCHHTFFTIIQVQHVVSKKRCILSSSFGDHVKIAEGNCRKFQVRSNFDAD